MLYENEMKEFCSKFVNTNGLCISVVGGNLVQFDEHKLSEWFHVPAVGYKEPFS